CPLQPRCIVMLIVRLRGRRAGVARSANLRFGVEMSPTVQRPAWPLSVLGLRLVSLLKDLLPEGRPIPAPVWAGRHKGIVRPVWLHAVGLLIATVLVDPSHTEGYVGGLLVGLLGVIAHRPGFSQRFRASMATLGLLLSSAVLVHLSGGVIEMHFHFFVAL